LHVRAGLLKLLVLKLCRVARRADLRVSRLARALGRDHRTACGKRARR
jgi:hypothetical protein